MIKRFLPLLVLCWPMSANAEIIQKSGQSGDLTERLANRGAEKAARRAVPAGAEIISLKWLCQSESSSFSFVGYECAWRSTYETNPKNVAEKNSIELAPVTTEGVIKNDR